MPLYADGGRTRTYGAVVIWGIVYVGIAVAAWPVLAFFLLRMGTIQTQYRQLGLAAGLALVWPMMLAFAGAARVIRSVRKPTGASLSPATPTV